MSYSSDSEEYTPMYNGDSPFKCVQENTPDYTKALRQIHSILSLMSRANAGMNLLQFIGTDVRSALHAASASPASLPPDLLEIVTLYLRLKLVVRFSKHLVRSITWWFDHLCSLEDAHPSGTSSPQAFIEYSAFVESLLVGYYNCEVVYNAARPELLRLLDMISCYSISVPPCA